MSRKIQVIKERKQKVRKARSSREKESFRKESSLLISAAGRGKLTGAWTKPEPDPLQAGIEAFRKRTLHKEYDLRN